MKHLVAYPSSLILFWAGHGLSRVMYAWDWSANFLYRPYHLAMCWSSDIEEWAGISFMWRARD